MKSKNKDHSNLSVMEAIATLSTITHFDVETISEDLKSDESQHLREKLPERNYQWLDNPAPGKGHIQEIFSVILNYLKKFYKNEHSYLTDPQTLEGIKNIMALVGDAAKKIDSYADLFKIKGSVTQLKEYKQLNEFYQSRIAHQINEGVLSKWILAISKNTFARQKELLEEFSIKATTLEDAPRHLFVNLDAVKKDTEYELFFIRKEDGSLFFSPRLLRNIKLICDFSAAEQMKDPLAGISIWVDMQIHTAAKNILHTAHDLIEEFYHEAFKFRYRELVSILHKSLMALFLCANPRNLMQESPPFLEKNKNCYSYFEDFHTFLREAYHSDDYHKLIAYPNDNVHDINHLLLNLIHRISNGVYLSLHRFHDFDPILQELIHLSHQNSAIKAAKTELEKPANPTLSKSIEHDYLALIKLFKFHSRGPLSKVLDILQEGYCHAFEPFMQLNLPSQLFAMALAGRKIINLHLPSPTYQEYIHRVAVLDEFKGFLRSYQTSQTSQKHLLINLQDRTSWREHFRSAALEELRAQENLNKSLAMVTIEKDTEFYHQLPPYQKNNHASTFIKQFKAQLKGDNSGYYFPSNIKSAITSDFAEEIMAAIHRIFFSNKNILLQEDRLNFIEIFDLFLILKIIDIVKPVSFSQTCKDGVDVGACSNAFLYIFLKMLDKEPIGEEIWTQFNRILYGPAIIVRERVPLKERFERFLNALKVVEFVYNDLGHDVFKKVIQEAFGHHYKSPIFNSTLVGVEI